MIRKLLAKASEAPLLSVAGLGSLVTAAFLVPGDHDIAGYATLGIAILLLDWSQD